MSDVFQDRNFVLGVVAASAVAIATLSYIIFGPAAWRGRAVRCTGLINLGNTCFVNAIIQALASLPPISEWLHRCHGQCKGKLTSSLKDLLHDLVVGEELEVSPRQVIDGLMRHGWIIGHQQQDALELYNIMLSTIEEEIIVSRSSLSELRGLVEITITDSTTTNDTVLTRLGRTVSPASVPRCPLRGLLVSALICCKCRKTLPSKYEYFDCLSLPMKYQYSGQVSLESSFKSYMSTEIVTGVECMHCSKVTPTNGRRNFTKKTQIGRLPACLCIHVVRTVWLSDGTISKNCAHFKFPMSFDVSQFTGCADNTSRMYKLRSVVEHIGGPHSGHYCTYRRHSNHWVYTSDSSVYSVTAQEVLQSQAYMLFYQRTS